MARPASQSRLLGKSDESVTLTCPQAQPKMAADRGFPPVIAQTLSHYRIVAKIGAGGMGEVYRAHDVRLDREVALKVLPAGMLANEDAHKRFRKEALALSKLNHPNIATIHDFDTQDGIDFLVMEFVDGLSLADKLKNGPLEEKETAALGTQMAEALEEAHEHGIVHSDLKPANLKVTPKGRLKVLDFGLARLLRPVESADRTRSLTETEAVAGTVPYMAPEQLQGDSADARSDLYAAGAVLYELATGIRAYTETRGPRLIDAILHKPPVTPRALNPRISVDLERIILKCLEKEPENRYQSAREMSVDLRRLAAPGGASPSASAPPARISRRYVRIAAGIAVIVLAGILVSLNVNRWRNHAPGRGVSSQIESVAVLPLDNFSRDPEQEYFADGMTDELITQLAKVRGLRVISRTSIMQYRATKKPLREIGKELNVDAIVEGSVQRVGDRVRITAQLIRASNDSHLWAESYDRNLRDVLNLESEVARAIAQQIRAQVSPTEQVGFASSRPVNPLAHDAYLKGLYDFNSGRDAFDTRAGQDALRRSLDFYRQAIQLDPNDALAYAGMARSFHWLAWFDRDLYEKSKEASRKAILLDDSLAEAHGALAYVLYVHDWDWIGSEREFKRAIELNPGYGEAHHGYALLLNALGREEEAIAEIDQAMELDPLVSPQRENAGLIYGCARQYDRAIQIFRSLLDLNPNNLGTHFDLADTYLNKGMYTESIEEYRKSLEHSRGKPRLELVANLNQARAYASAGNRAEAMQIFASLSQSSQEKLLDPENLAAFYASIGEKEKALASLEKAYREHAQALIFIRCERSYDGLRSDPRYQDLLRRIGLPP